MRTTLVLAAVAVLTPRVAAQDAPEFSLDECAARATHILVVDARGFVLDVWKGDAAPGDVIPLDALLASGVSTRGEALDRLMAHRHTRPPQYGKLILFLVKAPKPLPVRLPRGELCYGFWGRLPDELPQPTPFADFAGSAAARVERVLGDTPPSSDWWLPASRAGGMARSLAYLDDFGRVRARGSIFLFPAREPLPLLLGGRAPGGEEERAVTGWPGVGLYDTFRYRVDDAIRAHCGSGW